MTEPLVVRYQPEARAEFARRAAHDTVRRGRAAIAMCIVVALLVLVPLVALNVAEGFHARTLVLLAFLLPLPFLARWGFGRLRSETPTLDEVAFVVDDDEIRFEEQPSAASALRVVPAETWPIAGTTAEVRPSAVFGEHLVLRSVDGRRRAYRTEMLAVPAEHVVAHVADRARA